LDETRTGYISDDEFAALEDSPLRCKDSQVAEAMKEAVDLARKRGESLGGLVEVIACGLPIGLGSYVHWDRRLDGLLAQAIMSIHTVKGVGFGLGMQAGTLPGSEVHDEMRVACSERASPSRYEHITNRAGGIEGGMSNGEALVCRVACKPIPTLARSPEQSLRSINLETRQDDKAFYERSDVCVIPAAGVVCEAMVAIVLADQLTRKCGGDTLAEMHDNYQRYLSYVRTR
jgi:chorismate synthase